MVDARYLRRDGEMGRGDGKAVAVLFDGDVRLAVPLLGQKFAIPIILTNDMVKHAAWAAPSNSSGLVPGFSP